MRSRFESYVRHLGVTLSVKRKSDIPVPLPEALVQLANSTDWNRRIKIGPRFIFGLDQIEFDSTGNSVTFLINCADSSAREATYTTLDTGVLRPQPMKVNEGGASSAHLVIRLEQSKVAPLSYPALLEEADACSRTRIENFLNRLLSSQCEFYDEDPSRARRKVNAKLNLDVWRDRSIADYGDNARLLGVTLRRKSGAIDDDIIQQLTEEIRFQPHRGRGLEHARAVVRGTLGWLKKQPSTQSEKFHSMLLRVERPGGAGEATVEVPLSQAEDLAGHFQKVDVLEGFEKSLPSATDRVHPVLVQKMAEVLISRP